MLKSIGPKTYHWGSPRITRYGDERFEYTKTEEVWLVMNEDLKKPLVYALPVIRIYGKDVF